MIAGQLVRFAGVGALATVVHLTAALGGRAFLEMSAQAANLLGFLCAVLVSYVGHGRFTFQVDANHRVHLPRFAIVATIGLAISSLLTFVLFSRLGLPFAVAMATIAVIVPLVSFLGSRNWAFRDATAEQERLWLGICLSFTLALAFLWIFRGTEISHDVAWYLVATRAWLEGAELYIDIVEVNPPLNFYLTVPAILLADLLGLGEANAQFLWTAVLMFISLCWVWHLVGRTTLDLGSSCFFLAGVAVTVTIPTWQNVAQREHLLLLFMMPWLVAHLANPVPEQGRGAIARSAFAAVGLCLKPHFLLFPILSTLWLIGRRRSLRPILSASNMTLGVLGALYVVGAVLLHPAYFTEVIPIATEVYGAYSDGVDIIFSRLLNPLMLLPIAVAIVALRVTALASDIAFLILMMLAALGSYFAQWAGFLYHILPLVALGLLMCFWILVHVPRRDPRAWPALLYVLFAVAIQIPAGTYSRPESHLLRSILAEYGPGAGFAVFSDGLVPAFPAVLGTQARWTSRYPAYWYVPGPLNELTQTDCAETAQTCKRLGEILDMTRRDIVSDFVSGDVDVLLINDDLLFIDDTGFDWVTFLSEDSRFAAAFAELEPRLEIGPFRIFVRPQS